MLSPAAAMASLSSSKRMLEARGLLSFAWGRSHRLLTCLERERRVAFQTRGGEKVGVVSWDRRSRSRPAWKGSTCGARPTTGTRLLLLLMWPPTGSITSMVVQLDSRGRGDASRSTCSLITQTPTSSASAAAGSGCHVYRAAPKGLVPRANTLGSAVARLLATEYRRCTSATFRRRLLQPLEPSGAAASAAWPSHTSAHRENMCSLRPMDGSWPGLHRVRNDGEVSAQFLGNVKCAKNPRQTVTWGTYKCDGRIMSLLPQFLAAPSLVLDTHLPSSFLGFAGFDSTIPPSLRIVAE